MKKLPLNVQKSMKEELETINNVKVDKHLINKYRLAEILETPFDERSIESLAELQTYLLKISKLPTKFLNEHIEEPSYKSIIDYSLSTCEYKRINKVNSIIYNINQEADFFYIILDGKVKLLKLKFSKKEMTGINYYHILLNYKRKNENYLLKKTIDDNFYKCPVDINDMANIEKILIKINLMKSDIDKDYSENNPDYLETMVKNCGSSLSSFGLESYKEIINKKNEEILELNSQLIKEK